MKWKEVKDVMEKFGSVQVFRRGGAIYFKLRFPAGSEIEFGADNACDVVKWGVMQELKKRLGWKPLDDYLVGDNIAIKVHVLRKGVILVDMMVKDQTPIDIIRLEWKELNIDQLAQVLQKVDAIHGI